MQSFLLALGALPRQSVSSLKVNDITSYYNTGSLPRFTALLLVLHA